jgi:ubiquitin-protein ligase
MVDSPHPSQLHTPLPAGIHPLNHRYKGNTYNIPMDIWIPESYPTVPPTCFVTPTHGNSPLIELRTTSALLHIARADSVTV